MQFLDGKLLLSASDLVNFLGCRHATYLDLRDLTDPVEIPERDAATVLIFEKGLEHEKRYLTVLKARGVAVGRASRRRLRRSRANPPDKGGDAGECRGDLSSGFGRASLGLAMPTFWSGSSEASNLGAWSYEPVDTKLTRTAKPDHVIQLATYSKLIGKVQGRTPTEMHVELGNGERVSLRVSDFVHYHSIAQRRLETFANQPPEISTGGAMWSLSHLSLVRSLRCGLGSSRSPDPCCRHHPPSDQAALGCGHLDGTCARGVARRVTSSRVSSRTPLIDSGIRRRCKSPNATQMPVMSRHSR